VGTAITFDGSGSSDPDGDALTLTWDFGDGTTGTGTAPTHAYSTPGTKTVSLTANDGKTSVTAMTTATIIVLNAADPSRTTFSKSSGNSWSSVGGANLSDATDSGSNATRWKFTNLTGGFANSVGTIESIEFPNKCLKTPGVIFNAQIVLAPCDMNDVNQHWNSLRQQLSGGKGFYSFVSDSNQLALTEGPNSQVIQKDFNTLDTQLWAVRANGTNAFVTDMTPFLQ
jgi:PKD repeat protein